MMDIPLRQDELRYLQRNREMIDAYLDSISTKMRALGVDTQSDEALSIAESIADLSRYTFVLGTRYRNGGQAR